jgi:osmotically-inducible protein OsmY
LEIAMSNDTALKESVLAELLWEPSVKAAHIGVTARDGVIALTGHVQTYAEKHAAEAAVRRVKGVKAIAEEIEVKLSFEAKRSDEDIAGAIVSRMAWDSTLPKDAIKATVHDGWVTLTGEVNWHFEHDAAAQDVRRLWGVVGVTNDVTVKSRVDTLNVRDDINRALHRSWFDPSNVKVTADGGKVKLSGTVHSWSERRMAGTTAWAAPGATVVENDLIIA